MNDDFLLKVCRLLQLEVMGSWDPPATVDVGGFSVGGLIEDAFDRPFLIATDPGWSLMNVTFGEDLTVDNPNGCRSNVQKNASGMDVAVMCHGPSSVAGGALKTDDGASRLKSNGSSCAKTTTLLLHPDAVNTSACPPAPGGAAGTDCPAVLVPGLPVKDSRNPLFTEGSEPWDAFYDDGYPNVVLDPATGKYRVWHCSYQGPSISGFWPAKEGYQQMLSYRESTDGISWPMPHLGLVPYNGSRANNIVLGAAGGVGVTLDEDSADCRWKAIGETPADAPKICKDSGAVWCSADGLNWTVAHCIGSLGSRWDTHNGVFKPRRDRPWVVLSRSTNFSIGRQESRGTTQDFLGNYSQQTMLNLGQTSQSQIYAMRGFSASVASGRPEPALSKDLYLGLTMIYHSGTAPTVDCELSMSTDTVSWTRVFPGTPLIPRGSAGSYDASLNYCGSVPFAVNNSLALYYMGNRNPHNAHEEQGPMGAHPGGSLDLARLRLDGWAGYTACGAHPQPHQGCPGRRCNWTCPMTARVTTTRFLLRGTVLRVNLELRPGTGSLGVEVRHASNDTAVVGYALSAERLEADGTDVLVAWGSKRVMPAALLGSEVVLVFELKGAAVLYSYSVGCLVAAGPLKTDDGTVATPTKQRRRLIGVIQATASVSFVAANPANVSALPFDGIAIIADPPVPHIKSRFDPTEQSADFSFATMSTVTMNASALAAQLGQLRGLDLGDATENFLLIHANAAGPFAGFADGMVAANFRKLATAAAAAGLRGLLFDPECYRKDSSGLAVCWQPHLVCPSSCPKPCLPKPPDYLGPGCDGSCLVPCRAEALKAGEAVMAGVLSAWPAAQMMSMHGPGGETNLTHQHVPFMSDFAKDNPVSGSFLIGWISALHKHTQQRRADAARPLFLDGAEGYGFSNLSDVLEMKHWLKFGMATTDLVPPDLKQAYPSLETVSPGVYDFPKVYHGRGPGSPEMWKSDLVASLRGMDEEGVTWAYSERYDWFGPRNNDKPLVPQEWLDATREARALGQLPLPAMKSDDAPEPRVDGIFGTWKAPPNEKAGVADDGTVASGVAPPLVACTLPHGSCCGNSVSLRAISTTA